MVKRIKGIFYSKRNITFMSICGVLYLITYILLHYFQIDRQSLAPIVQYFDGYDSTMIFVLQFIFSLTPIPDILVTYFAVVLVGPIETFFLIYLGMLSASMVHFFIAKYLGASLVYKFFPRLKLSIEKFHGKMEVHELVLFRYFALVSFDIVAYVAGFGGVKFRKFFVATALGLPPLIIPNILLAHGLFADHIFWSLVLWAGAGVIIFLLAYLIRKFY